MLLKRRGDSDRAWLKGVRAGAKGLQRLARPWHPEQDPEISQLRLPGQRLTGSEVKPRISRERQSCYLHLPGGLKPSWQFSRGLLLSRFSF